MNKKQEIQQSLTAAMKSRDEATKRTLRLVLSSIKLAEVETGKELDDERILGILQKEIKTRDDTIEESQHAHREDLVQQAQIEKKILNRFLPEQMSADKLNNLADEIIQNTGAMSMADMGKVMKELLQKLQGRASAQDASKIVRERLQKH
jgi:uncharacterized protein YqeY